MGFDQDAHVGQDLLALLGKDALELHLTLTLLPDGFHDALLGLGYRLGFVEEYPVQPPRAGGHTLCQKLLHTALWGERVHNRLAVALPIIRSLVSIDDGLQAEDPMRGSIEPDSEFTLRGLGPTFPERPRAHDASSFQVVGAEKAHGRTSRRCSLRAIPSVAVEAFSLQVSGFP